MDQDAVRIDLAMQIKVKQWTESIVKWLTHLSEKMITNETVEKEAIDESRKEHPGVGRGNNGSGLATRPQSSNHVGKYKRFCIQLAESQVPKNNHMDLNNTKSTAMMEKQMQQNKTACKEAL